MAKALVLCFIILGAIVTSIFVYLHLKHEKVNQKSNPPIVYNVTVSNNKPGAHNTLMDALASAPTYSNTKYYIHVEAGLYIERVEVWENLTNIVLIGDGAPTTKIQWNRHSPDFRTFETATLSVRGNGFIAMFLTFENIAGDGSQAVAVLTSSNRVAYYKCIFLGYQDTLYAKQGVQFYKDCDIYGTVDFIFGRATAIFQPCNLYARLPKTITFTAQQKEHDSLSQSGFVIQNCTLTVAPGLEQQKFIFRAFLGRPWSNYSTVVVMESYLDNIIQPVGWLGWENRTTNKLTYLEFENKGPGASTDKRVNWGGYEDVSGQPDKVQRFTVGKFINGDDWLPKAGIPYSSGFINN